VEWCLLHTSLMCARGHYTCFLQEGAWSWQKYTVWRPHAASGAALCLAALCTSAALDHMLFEAPHRRLYRRPLYLVVVAGGAIWWCAFSACCALIDDIGGFRVAGLAAASTAAGWGLVVTIFACTFTVERCASDGVCVTRWEKGVCVVVQAWWHHQPAAHVCVES